MIVKQKGDVMVQNKFSGEMPKVVLVPKPRRIAIVCTELQRAYALYDTKTGTQVKDFVKCDGEKIEFDNLDPNMHYDVGVIENMGDEKPQFAIAWNMEMRDETEEILKNSNGLPVNYPCVYHVRYNDNNSNGIYDIVDDNGEKVGEVANLSPQGDKPEFVMVFTCRMKDDTVK